MSDASIDGRDPRPAGSTAEGRCGAIDLRDHRGRLIRLGIAAAVGFVVTFIVIHWINSVSRAPNADPVGSSTVPLLAIGMFVVVTAVVAGVLARISRPRAPSDR